MATDMSPDQARAELERILSDLVRRFGNESPQQASQIYVAMVAGLSALVMHAGVEKFADQVSALGDATSRQSDALVKWTKVLAFATVVLVVVTLVGAAPAVSGWLHGR